MIEDFLEKQNIACSMVKKIVATNNTSHAYLIETNNYCHGYDFALAFAKTLLCPKNNTSYVNCGQCTQCLRITNNSFSDLEIIEPDGMWIKKEQMDKLQKNFSTKSLEGSRKVYIINHADKLNTSASNSILKFLEEPEENIIAILVVDNIYSLLDTIISRCQIIKLNNKKSDNIENNTLDKVCNYLFNNQIEIDAFKNSDGNELILSTVKFIEKIEEFGTDVILKENEICLMFIKDKNLFEDFVSIGILFYKECLDFKVRNIIEDFIDYSNEISSVCAKNNCEKLLNKIEILTKMQERIKYNCNLNLVLDKLIITLGGI